MSCGFGKVTDGFRYVQIEFSGLSFQGNSRWVQEVVRWSQQCVIYLGKVSDGLGKVSGGVSK